MGDAPVPVPPPTAYLPAIRKLGQVPPERIQDALEYLRGLYNPPVRGVRQIGQRRVLGPPCAPLPLPLPAPTSLEDEVISEDSFERAYSVRWLTALVSACSDEDVDVLFPERILHDAAALLALCSGTAGAGTFQRIFSLGTPSGDAIAVTLTDAPLENADYGSVGAQTWGSACVLAELLAAVPAAFVPEGSARVLELGAGTGLVSLALGKVLAAGTVIATDFYPAVLTNLERNVADNFQCQADVQVSVQALEWSTFPAAYDGGHAGPVLQAPFDALFGADIAYELAHARWLRACVARLLRQPDKAGARDPRFHLVLPRRHTHAAEARAVEEVFPPAVSGHVSVHDALTLAVVSKDVLVCAAERGEEVEYVYYSIGWR
jgi:predicted nicotinamide N-methyase